MVEKLQFAHLASARLDDSQPFAAPKQTAAAMKALHGANAKTSPKGRSQFVKGAYHVGRFADAAAIE